MLTQKGNSFRMREYRGGICEVFGVDIEHVLQNEKLKKIAQVKNRQDPNIKRVLKVCYKDETEEGNKAASHFLTEVVLLAGLKHPFIMSMEAVGSFPKYFGFAMPFYEQGTLTKALPTMTHELRDECLVQLCCGIKFLHDRGVAHRDLKTDNILLTNKNNVVIADFGLGDYASSTGHLVTTIKGTYMYISPEQWISQPFVVFKCDMYALGVVYWCMLYKMNVIELQPKEPLLTIVSRTFNVPGIDRDILSCLLEEDPAKRFSVLSLINLLNDSERFDHRIKLLREIGLL
nr:serine/threonine-protein kinase ULK3-like [Biomphalaria glabrata]